MSSFKKLSLMELWIIQSKLHPVDFISINSPSVHNGSPTAPTAKRKALKQNKKLITKVINKKIIFFSASSVHLLACFNSFTRHSSALNFQNICDRITFLHAFNVLVFWVLCFVFLCTFLLFWVFFSRNMVISCNL